MQRLPQPSSSQLAGICDVYQNERGIHHCVRNESFCSASDATVSESRYLNSYVPDNQNRRQSRFPAATSSVRFEQVRHHHHHVPDLIHKNTSR
jgi:hypothetical protein